MLTSLAALFFLKVGLRSVPFPILALRTDSWPLTHWNTWVLVACIQRVDLVEKRPEALPKREEHAMLIRFEVENFRSIVGPAELTMVAIDEDRPQARNRDRIPASLLTTAGIFGPNASGKSNVLAALVWLRRAISQSLRTWDESIPVEPFAFGEARSHDSSFSLEMEVDGVRFDYLLDVGRERVSYEALFHYPEGRKRRIFERDGNQLDLQRGLGVLAGTRALLTDRSLVLSIMRRFDEPLTRSFARSALRMTTLGHSLTGYRALPSGRLSSMSLFGISSDDDQDLLFELEEEEWRSEQQLLRQQAMSMLRLADLGVTDVLVDPVPNDGTPINLSKRVPKLVHASGQDRVPFAYRDESAGTRTWFELIGPVLEALRRGSIVLFDELDASLHPTLTVQILHLFQNHASNPKGAQLLFTSHDTNLLNHLGRDEVWLTDKTDGATRFAPLSGFAGERVRRSKNLETAYLSGRFGGLPDVTRPEVLRDLGLIG
jgi:hypothetical protein